MKVKNSKSALFWEKDPIVVQRDCGVRPNQPATVQTRCRWIIGDVIEVLDHNTWKLGKIAKMLKNNYFVIRLADCIQLKEFHISSLRVPVPAPTAPHSKQFSAVNKTIQRGKQLSSDLLRRSGKKRKSTAVLESPQPRKTRFTESHKAAASLLHAITADHCFQYRHSQVREEPEECSVASCSANDVQHFTSGRNLQCSVGCGDAMSAAACIPCTSGRGDNGESRDRPAINIHDLELEAYQSTVRALHASGPMTWEQESLLTNLRLSLNISNEEHLLQLRHLLSS